MRNAMAWLSENRVQKIKTALDSGVFSCMHTVFADEGKNNSGHFASRQICVCMCVCIKLM